MDVKQTKQKEMVPMIVDDPDWIAKYDEETEQRYQAVLAADRMSPDPELNAFGSRANALLLMREIDKEILTELVQQAKNLNKGTI